MRILIIKLGAVGDVLRTTSILPGLKDKYLPERIDWIASNSGKEVLWRNSFIHQIYVWSERKTIGAYDLVIGLEDDFPACQLVSNIQSDRKIGAFVHDGKIAYTPSAWFDMSVISKFGIESANKLKKKNRKTFQQCMAELLGIGVAPYVFNLAPEEVEYGQKFVRDLGISKRERVAGISTGAGKRWQFKALGIEKTIELVKRLKKDLGVVSVILGGEEEKKRNEIISKETDMLNGGLHSLRNFAGVVNQSEVLVCSDSLALHFGIALGKRSVVFFGPTSPSEIELYGLGTKVYPRMDCLVCYKRKCEIKPSCMDELSVDELFEAAKKELSRA